MKALKCRDTDLEPKVEILVPLAARRLPLAPSALSAGEAGKTEMSAPESIRKGRRNLWQKRDRDPEEGTALTEGIMPGEKETTGPRLGRFPTADVDEHQAEADCPMAVWDG